MIARGWDLGPSGADGDFGDISYGVARSFQAEKGLNPVDGLVGKDTWAASWNAPVT
jgi:peptidoglycan hydrolase-like protein with peptidoglycan-binding domain